MQRSERDLSDFSRSVGGLLFAVGAVVLLVRKSGNNEWSDAARVAVVFVPAAVLYLLAIEPEPRERARPWQSVFVVAATLLIPVVLFEFLNWIGASTRHVLYDAAVFALTGVLAGYAARRARVTFAVLLAGLAFLATWLLVWDKILSNPSADTFRWLLVAWAAILLLAALRLARAGGLAAGEVAIAGGVAAVAAGLFGVIVSTFVGTVGRVVTAAHSIRHLQTHTSGAQHLGWDIYLLIVSLALIGVGSQARVRGLTYVGAIGLGTFIISAGVQITRVQSGQAPTHDVLAWPLVLVILGGAALCLSLARSRSP